MTAQKARVPLAIMIVPQGKERRRLKKSMASPAAIEPVSIPKLWATVMMDITEPMAFFSSPLITA